MAENMVRTQVYLPKGTYEALQERAEKQGLTMATQIRAALDEYLRRAQGDDEGPILQPDDPIFKMIGMYDSGLSDVAVNHDYYLYGAPKRVRSVEKPVQEPKRTSYKAPQRRLARRRKSKR